MHTKMQNIVCKHEPVQQDQAVPPPVITRKIKIFQHKEKYGEKIRIRETLIRSSTF